MLYHVEEAPCGLARLCRHGHNASMFPTQAVSDAPTMLGPLISPRWRSTHEYSDHLPFFYIICMYVYVCAPRALLSHLLSSTHPLVRWLEPEPVCGPDRFERKKSYRISLHLLTLLPIPILSHLIPSHQLAQRKNPANRPPAFEPTYAYVAVIFLQTSNSALSRIPIILCVSMPPTT